MLPAVAYAPAPLPNIQDVRNRFPALQSGFTYLENAGGSQVPASVADAIRDYMLTSYVQIGANYDASQRATQTVADAHAFMELWVNAQNNGKVILGPSATALVNIVANAYADTLQPGDEIIIAESNHEANAGPWERLEKRGATIKFWKVDPQTYKLPLDELERLLTSKTRIVAFPQVSNLLGDTVDVQKITEFVHSKGAKVFVDGVAYAPHGVVDVTAWNVDWYVFSNYKVYGPHMATLYAQHDAIEELTGPNHFFIPKDAIPSKWELGALNHEGCAGLLGLEDYVTFLSGHQEANREAIVKACQTMAALEKPLTDRFLGYLANKEGVQIIGPGPSKSAIGTISFTSRQTSNIKIVDHLIANQIGTRAGHMYALRLCQALDIDLSQGVVRLSLLHYNTREEIEKTIAVLDEVL
ncbi:MAG: cysteine desulfurase-like protein [Fimbriimonas sp.]